MKKILGLIVFFGLCVFAFHYRENHESTARKEQIAQLEAKIGHLRSENTELHRARDGVEGVNQRMKARLEELGHPWEKNEAAENASTERSDD